MQGSIKDIYSKGELLKDMGLDVPQITKVFEILQGKGLDVRGDIFTLEEGFNELLKFFGKEVSV